MRFARPFQITSRTALGLVVGGVAFFAHYNHTDRSPLSSKTSNKLNYFSFKAFGPESWRTSPGALKEALQRELSSDVEAARESGESSSPLLAYALRKAPIGQEDAEVVALDSTMLLGADAPAFVQALAAYKTGDFTAGDTAASTLKAKLAITAAQWAGLRTHSREAGFTRLNQFMSAHPDWPAQEWLRRRTEETLLGDHVPDNAIKKFFAEARPLTPAGKLALARVLGREGDFDAASALVRDAWREGDLNEGMESLVRREFADFLTPADHKYRADRLLYAEKNGAALRAAELAGKDVALLARVRAAANNDYGNDKLFATIPPSLQGDPGLLFARVHLLRKQERIAEAGALLLNAPREPERVIDGDAWWTERRLVARKLLDLGDAKTAYAICAQHLAHSVSAKVEAEFHAGWIALRFLHDLPGAERHFDLLSQIAETPIQKSRALYWRARVAEARHTQQEEQRRPRLLYGGGSPLHDILRPAGARKAGFRRFTGAACSHTRGRRRARRVRARCRAVVRRR